MTLTLAEGQPEQRNITLEDVYKISSSCVKHEQVMILHARIQNLTKGDNASQYVNVTTMS